MNSSTIGYCKTKEKLLSFQGINWTGGVLIKLIVKHINRDER